MPYISDRYNIAYFPVPKIACTSLKHYFYEVQNGKPFVDHKDSDGNIVHVHDIIPSISFYSNVNQSRLTECHRIAVIRDPIDRFVSAYTNRVLFHEELSSERLNIPLANALNLAPNPEFEQFVYDLEKYRLASPSIMHHTNPATYFLGHDLGYYHRVYNMSEIVQLRTDVSTMTGTDYAVPHEQKAGMAFTRPSPDHECWLKVREFYSGDYALLKGHI